jgi:sucrose phosphorylase
VPDDRYLSVLFMRKPGFPILTIPFPDGSFRHYWNTFYQNVSISSPHPEELSRIDGVDEDAAAVIADTIRDAVGRGVPLREIDLGEHNDVRGRVVSYVGRRCTTYLGQMDLNARSESVWEFYRTTIDRLAAYGAKIIRLDAFAYLHKEVGSRNFFNTPGTWEYLARIDEYARSRGVEVLPEIHAAYADHVHDQLAERGYPFYDFFFPGLLIDAIETVNAERLCAWISEVTTRGFRTVTMLGCHDGIPVLDVKGLLDDASIDRLIEVITARGGRVKDLYGPDGRKISYYQVNATFFSALGEDESAMLLARAIHLFMPGLPQVWYLDLFAGINDLQAADAGGHKEINRTNLSMEEIESRVPRPVVRRQIELIRFRNTFPAWGDGAQCSVSCDPRHRLTISWRRGDARATLDADIAHRTFSVSYADRDGEHELVLR